MTTPVMLTRCSTSRPTVARLFDRKLKALQRSHTHSDQCEIHRAVAEQMLDRRQFIKRETPVILEVGAHTGWFFKHLIASPNLHGLKQYIQTDISEDRLNKNYNEIKDKIPPGVEFVQICADEEDPQPFGLPDRSVDFVVSNLTMHWVNDLERCMTGIRQVLKRDAMFMMSMLGGNTLYELRSAFAMAQTDRLGGVSSYVSPMIDGAGISTLMLQSGFTLPTLDMDRHVMMYSSPIALMEHLHAMGESACHVHRKPLTKNLIASMQGIYKQMYGKNNLYPSTFEVFHVIGWSPCPTQRSALQRGAPAIPMQSISTGANKELNSELENFAKNPDDIGRQNSVFQKLTEMTHQTRDRLEKLGLDAPNLTNSPKHGLPPPPGQDGQEAQTRKAETANAAAPSYMRNPLTE